MSGDHNQYQKDRSYLDDRRGDIIRMAQDSGVLAGYEGEPSFLERFADLVAAYGRRHAESEGSMTQPEALRLADALEATDQMHANADLTSAEVANELRRLHAANIDCVDHFNALMTERNELLEALNEIVRFWDSVVPNECVNEMHIKARAAINKATGEQK